MPDPSPTLTPSNPASDDSDPSRNRAAASKPYRLWAPVGALFLVAFASGAGFFDGVGSIALRALDIYAQSQLAIFGASGHVVDGRAQYATLIDDKIAANDPGSALEAMAGVRFERKMDLAHWYLVSTRPGDSASVDALESADFVRIVIPNRGLWFCG
ncbi:MAG: hypothetical protein ISN28_05760 [Ectothiorhodospiraceae bacterium AqS1]|nr:hypothetical protein [Ectothiorhodospiraceae bacterium AqS1]